MDNKANYNWQCMNYTLYLLLPTTIILLSSNSIELYTNTKNTSILFIEHKHTPNNLFYFFSLLVFVYPLFWLGFYYTFFSIEKSSGPISLYNIKLQRARPLESEIAAYVYERPPWYLYNYIVVNIERTEC